MHPDTTFFSSVQSRFLNFGGENSLHVDAFLKKIYFRQE